MNGIPTRRLILLTASTALAAGTLSATSTAFAAPTTPHTTAPTTAPALINDGDEPTVGGEAVAGDDAYQYNDGKVTSGPYDDNPNTVKHIRKTKYSSPAIYTGGSDTTAVKKTITRSPVTMRVPCTAPMRLTRDFACRVGPQHAQGPGSPTGSPALRLAQVPSSPLPTQVATRYHRGRAARLTGGRQLPGRLQPSCSSQEPRDVKVEAALEPVPTTLPTSHRLR
ncbi:hypothetical protein [Streptomyces sp. NPDC093225]|uniref:hypothetical protein n=1 Tax=Streptomyces sp. NPDC093225 TaxID=3366034 RepID=UPI00382119E9